MNCPELSRHNYYKYLSVGITTLTRALSKTLLKSACSSSSEEEEDDEELDEEDDDNEDEDDDADADRLPERCLRRRLRRFSFFFMRLSFLLNCLNFLESWGCALNGRPEGGGGTMTSMSSGGIKIGWLGSVIAFDQLSRIGMPCSWQPKLSLLLLAWTYSILVSDLTDLLTVKLSECRVRVSSVHKRHKTTVCSTRFLIVCPWPHDFHAA